MAEQKQDDQLKHTYSSYVRIRDIALKTCQRRWTIGRSDERGSVISVLGAWHDDVDDDQYTYEDGKYHSVMCYSLLKHLKFNQNNYDPQTDTYSTQVKINIVYKGDIILFSVITYVHMKVNMDWNPTVWR